MVSSPAVAAARVRNRVLFVDHAGAWRTMLAWELTERGYEVDPAETAEEALDTVAVCHPDFVVCNLTLGRSKTYFEGVRRIREVVGADVPVVVYSGYASFSHEKAAREAGCSEYLERFVDDRRLLALFPSLI
jgi:DNA-binding response OmpR family regulator